jgi:CBS domain containing-hemolysin-like protein
MDSGQAETRATPSTSRFVAAVFLLSAAYGLSVFALLWSIPLTRLFVERHVWPVALGLALLVMLLSAAAAAPGIRAWIRVAGGVRRATVLVFVLLPVVIAAILSIALANPAPQIAIVRAAFLLIVSMLPAIMFFLFIATRKASMFKEFLANMDRLNFFAPRSRLALDGSVRLESEADRQRRIAAY